MIFKPPAKHRFLHSLVFSSVLILEGCATGAAGTSASTTYTPTEASATTSTQASSTQASSQGSTVQDPAVGSLSETRPSSAQASALDDVRYCERGWATTKSGGGNSFQECRTVELDDGTELTECTDQEGRCLRK